MVQSSETEPCSYDTGDSWDQRRGTARCKDFLVRSRSNRTKTHSRTPRHTPVLAEVTSGTVAAGGGAAEGTAYWGPGEAGGVAASVARRRPGRAGGRGLPSFGGRRRSLELGWGAEATEGPCGLRGGPDPARPSSLAGQRLCGRKSNRCLCSFHRPRLSGRRALAGRPWPPSPNSARAAQMRLPGLGLGFEWEEEERRRLDCMQWGTAAGRSASDSSARKLGGCSV